jgi:hypothetical protein
MESGNQDGHLVTGNFAKGSAIGHFRLPFLQTGRFASWDQLAAVAGTRGSRSSIPDDSEDEPHCRIFPPDNTDHDRPVHGGGPRINRHGKFQSSASGLPTFSRALSTSTPNRTGCRFHAPGGFGAIAIAPHERGREICALALFLSFSGQW